MSRTRGGTPHEGNLWKMRTSPSEQRKITARLATRGPIPKGRAAFCAEDPPARIPSPAPVGAAPVRLCPVQHQRPGPLQAAQPTEHLAAFGVAGPWPSERAHVPTFRVSAAFRGISEGPLPRDVPTPGGRDFSPQFQRNEPSQWGSRPTQPPPGSVRLERLEHLTEDTVLRLAVHPGSRGEARAGNLRHWQPCPATDTSASRS